MLLCPNKTLPSLDGSTTTNGLVRSKRSIKYRKGHEIQGKSILGDEDSSKGKGKARAVPTSLIDQRRDVVRRLVQSVNSAEWKSMSVDAVGSAAVQLILELEVEDGDGEREGSLSDHLTEGLVSALQNGSISKLETQPFLLTLQSSPTGTRLFETLLRVSPPNVFSALWTTYFVGKIGKLAAHPFANFVVAKGVSRLDQLGLENVIRECAAVSGGRGLISESSLGSLMLMIETARTSVLQALVDRATVLGQCEKAVVEVGFIRGLKVADPQLIISALDLTDQSALVPCLMALKTFPVSCHPMYRLIRCRSTNRSSTEHHSKTRSCLRKSLTRKPKKQQLPLQVWQLGRIDVELDLKVLLHLTCRDVCYCRVSSN